MPIWWRYKDIVRELGEPDPVALKRDLMRCLATGRVVAVSDQVFYNIPQRSVRQYYVTIPPEYWQESHKMFSGDKRLNFRPEINKLFNPAVKAPAGLESEGADTWAADCFDISYPAEEVSKEFGLSPPAKPTGPVARQRDRAPSDGPGAKVDALRWEQFAAAMAVLADRGDLILTSENKAHKSVADFLAERGHVAMSIDTVRSLIRRFKAWKAGHSFVDDEQPEGN